MSTLFGEVNWTDDNSFGDKEKKSGKDLFLRLSPGDNEMRFITQPHQYLVHKIKKDENNPKDYGQKVMCSAINGSCPACKYGEAKPRWFVGVIDRKTNSYKILDMGWAVFQQIKKHAKNPKLGDPQKYDVNIFVDPKGGATGYYTVQTYSKEPLSAEDQTMKDSVDLEDLKRRVTPMTPENVQKRLDKIFGDTPSEQKSQAPASKASAEDEALSEEFPAFEEAST